jgi:phosphoadenosine phosphosulfate reductase
MDTSAGHPGTRDHAGHPAARTDGDGHPGTPAELERYGAQELLAHVLAEHHPRLALACSFQKEEAVLIDMLLALEPRARVFTIDTGVLFPETYAFWRALEQRYDLRMEVFDALDPDGVPWSAERCCGAHKVGALERALEGLDAWITGMRREQAPTRGATPKLAWDEHRRVWKANPLADWTETQVWAYIAAHDLPYNPLHDRGYSSIGCAPCTLPGAGREGRWAGSDKTECGLHVEPAAAGEAV